MCKVCITSVLYMSSDLATEEDDAIQDASYDAANAANAVNATIGPTHHAMSKEAILGKYLPQNPSAIGHRRPSSGPIRRL